MFKKWKARTCAFLMTAAMLVTAVPGGMVPGVQVMASEIDGELRLDTEIIEEQDFAGSTAAVETEAEESNLKETEKPEEIKEEDFQDAENPQEKEKTEEISAEELPETETTQETEEKKAEETTAEKDEDVEEENERKAADVDSSITLSYARWVNGKDLEGSTEFPSMEGADDAAILTSYQNGVQASPVYTTTGGTGTNYYIGSKGLGSGANPGYYQFSFSPNGKYGKYCLSFSMRGSNTGAKDWTLSYSTDGSAYTDVMKFSITKASTYEDFSGELPEAANGSSVLYLRLTPGSTSIGNSTVGTSGTNYLSDIEITASPVLSDGICRPVMISPEAGEVAAGQELTFATATEGAAVYYTINDGTESLYNASSKPVLTEEVLKNGAKVTAYAKLSGKEDSITTTAEYTQSQVGTVKASPNGGSVVKGTVVKLTCATEGALIQYSADDGATWQNYTDGLTLTALPVVYKVKAVKEGYKDSSELTLSFKERSSEKYNIYFGQLHSHTSYSDGAGSCEEAYQHASGVDNLDFLAVTDHSNSFDNADSASLADGSVSSEWTEGNQLAQQYTTNDFVGLFGFEMTWSNGLGHMNTFNTDGFQSRTQTRYAAYNTALQNYYADLKTQPDSISQFNHPGTTFGDFSDFAYYDEEIDRLITTIEVGNGEGAIGSSGYFPSYEYYQRALDKGWHVAPTNNQDNHKGLWGDANTARSVVLADSLTTENVYDAMRNYRVYATEDNDLNIYYTLDGNIMGSILEEGQTGEQVELKVELSDATDASVGNVQVITNGGIVLEEKNVASSSETVTFTVDNDYSYYYIKVVQPDGDIAVTAPVWTGTVEAAGINSISTDEVLPVQGEALNVNLDLYNNEDSEMTVNSIDFTVNNEVVHSADLTAAGLNSVPSMGTASYSFDYTYNKVGSMELKAVVSATLGGVLKKYESVLKLTYVKPEMVTKVLIDGTHYNDYVTGYYGDNVGNFTAIAGRKNIKVEVVKDEITPEMLSGCALLVISAPARKTGTANAGAYSPSHFSDDFISMVKNYTDNGGALIACGIADYQDSTEGQTSAEMNRLLAGIGATTTLNSDEAYDTENNGGQPYRLYLKNYNNTSRYLAGAVADVIGGDGTVVSEGQEYSAYSGCTVNLDEAAVAAGKAEALVRGYDTTYSIDCKDAEGKSVSGSPTMVEKGNVVSLAHETLDSGANIFVAGSVFISDFEVKAELDNNWDLPYLNRTIAENILDEVTVKLDTTPIAEVRANGKMGDVFAIEGYVTAGTNVEGNIFFDTIYVQDDTAGITVFPYSVSGLEVGTKVRITGYVDEYQGDKELQVMSSEILSSEEKHVYEPEKMTAKDAMDYEKSGGKLVRVEGTVVDVLYDAEQKGVSQFWLEDGSGVTANIFIDGYILSGTSGKNELASIVKKGAVISAAGLVYAHPEGTSDVAVTCLRVRNCDEITLSSAGGGTDTGTDTGADTGTGAGSGEGIDSAAVPIDITNKAEVIVNDNSCVYDGTAKEPAVTVSVNGNILVNGTDYTVSYADNINAGTAVATITGKNGYTGTVTQNFTIEKAAKKITVSKTSVKKAYGSKAFSLGAKTVSGEKLTYATNAKKVATVNAKGKVTVKNIGKAIITITSKESANYKKAVKKVTITVQPKKEKISSVKSSKTAQMTVKWKKDAKASGYQITYSTSKKFTKAKTKSVTVKSYKTTSKTISKLKKGKTYYVKVRAYKTVNGKKIYGTYSAVKKIKIK